MHVLRRAIAVLAFILAFVIATFVTHIATLPVRRENWPSDVSAHVIDIEMPLIAAVLFTLGLGVVFLFGRLWGTRRATHAAWCFYLFGCGFIILLVYGRALADYPSGDSEMFGPWLVAAFVSWRTSMQTVMIADIRASRVRRSGQSE